MSEPQVTLRVGHRTLSYMWEVQHSVSVGVDPTGRRVTHMSVNPASEYRYDMSGENLPVGQAGICDGN